MFGQKFACLGATLETFWYEHIKAPTGYIAIEMLNAWRYGRNDALSYSIVHDQKPSCFAVFCMHALTTGISQ